MRTKQAITTQLVTKTNCVSVTPDCVTVTRLCQHYTRLCQHYTRLCQCYTRLCQHYTRLCQCYTRLCQHYTRLCQHYTRVCQHYTIVSVLHQIVSALHQIVSVLHQVVSVLHQLITHFIWAVSCDCEDSPNTCPMRSTTAALVSSKLLSMPRTVRGLSECCPIPSFIRSITAQRIPLASGVLQLTGDSLFLSYVIKKGAILTVSVLRKISSSVLTITIPKPTPLINTICSMIVQPIFFSAYFDTHTSPLDSHDNSGIHNIFHGQLN